MWIALSLLSAVSLATSDLFCKLALKQEDPLYVAWVRVALPAPLLLLFLPFSKPPKDFFLFGEFVLLLLPFEVLALILYVSALKRSPLSLTVPFLAFTPVFILLTGLLFLGEKPESFGVIGVGMIAAGAYLLSSRRGQGGLLAPFKNFWREQGSLMMAVVALIYSITAPLGKKCILISSPLFMASTYFSLLALVLTCSVLVKDGRKSFRPFLARPIFCLIGLTQAISILSHVHAISISPAAYMIAVKRTSLLIGVIYGLFILKEEEMQFRLLGSLMMLAGIFTLGFAD